MGRVTVELPKLKVTEATTPLASTLWAKLRAKKVLVGQLAQRRRRMKEIGKTVLKEGIVALEPEPEQDLASQPLVTAGPLFSAQPARREAKVGRNAPCPCGSGRKYKRCCLGKANANPGR
ncbi:MAG: SEC-C domain-containing protein [Myxococcales bacterium]|nr:SEC-C domain-containing protein [Myxococcales bacterium]